MTEMRNGVPLARPRGEVAGRDGQARAIGQLLQLPLPEPEPGAVAASGIGRDEQRARAPVAGAPHLLPPAADRAHRKAGSVVVDPDAHPAGVAGEVVDAVGHRLALDGDEEVVHPHGLGQARRAPRPPGILEIPHQLLLLRVHGDHRLVRGLKPADLRGDVAELGVPVGVRRAFPRLAVGLKLYPAALKSSRTSWWLMRWPMLWSVRARVRVLFAVQRSGESGGPEVVGPTSPSRSRSSVGSLSTVRFRPPPGRRTRPGATRARDRSSFSPRAIVEVEIPVARATRAMPPRPRARASVAAHTRRDRSVSVDASARYFARQPRRSTHVNLPAVAHILPFIVLRGLSGRAGRWRTPRR